MPQRDDDDVPVPPSCALCHRLTDCATIHGDSVPDCPSKLCQACTELAELNKKIAAVHEQLASLVRQRQAAKSRVNLQHDQLTGRLPLEIICEIFLLAADNTVYDIWVRQLSIRAPLLLGAVCKRWRNITLGLPRLWSTLNVIYCGAHCVNLPEEWLCRSVTEPLRVEYYGDYPLRASIFHSNLRLANVLRSHAARWQCFSFTGRWKQLHQLLDTLDDLSQLDTVSISISGWQIEEFWEPIRLKQPIAPRNLTIHNTPLSHIPFQWTNLTHLDANYLQLSDFLHIIRHANNLISCTIHGLSSNTEEASYTPIIHPLVTTIDFDGTNLLSFPYITFPSLKTLNHSIFYDSSVPFDYPVDICDTLCDFIDRSGARLDTFSLSIWLRSTPIPLSWFDRLPWITHLEITVDGLNSDLTNIGYFFRALAQSSDPLILPHLEDLHFHVEEMSRSDWIAVCDALRFHTSRVKLLEMDTELSSSNAHIVGAEEVHSQHPRIRNEGHGARPLSMVHIEYSNWAFWQRFIMDIDILWEILDIQASGFHLKIVDRERADVLVPTSRLYLNCELPFSDDFD